MVNEIELSLQQKLERLERENRKLKNRLDQYEMAVNGAHVGLWDWNVEADQFFVSDPWKRMLGIPENDPVAREQWVDYLHEDDRERALEQFDAFVEGIITPFHVEFRLKHRDGSYRWILSKANAVRDINGKAIRISGSHTDITDEKRSANIIQKNERKYRNLFQNSLVAMCSTNAEMDQIFEANERFWTLFALQPGERKRFNLQSLFQRRHFKAFRNQLFRTRIIENQEYKLTCSNDQELWVLINAVYSEEDNTVDLVIKDITQTKGNLIELQKVNFELDSFVYHASHDLRSPLRSILGLIELYRMEQDSKVRIECIEKIESSVHRLDDLVVELLSLSRNDRVNDPHTPIQLIQEVNNSIASYYNASDTTALEITSRILQPVPFISDATRVRIILNNLISNAIKYRSFRREQSSIHIEMDVNKERVIIKVVDNGEGIEDSKLPHIFDMFYRATERSEGSGLGLYIVKKVADKLDARIDVESEEMAGTTFTVTIPNSRPE